MAEVIVSTQPAIVEEALVTPEDNVVKITFPISYPSRVRCTVIAGPIQFSGSGAVIADNPSIIATGSIEMLLTINSQLHFLATAQNDSFNLEVIG